MKKAPLKTLREALSYTLDIDSHEPFTNQAVQKIIRMGADKAQCLKAIQEAEAYPGPSLVIAYAPCINHGIKAGMGCAQREAKKAVDAGYWHLYRYNPTQEEAGKNGFSLDSKDPVGNIKDFLMIAPIIVLIGASFSQESHLVFPPSGFSLKWYTAFFNSKPFMNSFFISFELAVASAVTGLILGTISAYSIERSPFRNVLLSLFISPLMVPGVIISLALLRFSVTFDLVHGFWLMLIGHGFLPMAVQQQ